MEPRADPAWDSFWRYDRLSSFHAKPGAPNYGPPVADGWHAFFDQLPTALACSIWPPGNGAIAVLAVAAGRRFAVTGADLAAVEPSAFVTQNRAELAQITFLASTPAEALPLPDASIDAIVSQYGVEYSDLSRSLPEAARMLAPGGRLRFACHAAEGARGTPLSHEDAASCRSTWSRSRAGTRTNLTQASRPSLPLPAATVCLMLANVHHSLCDTFDHRRDDLVATAAHLVEEIAAHRDRQAALLAAARTSAQMKDMGAALEIFGLTALGYSEQREGAELIGHVIEARRG